MNTLEVPVKVTKEAYELGQGLAKFLKATKQALADGWQPGQDLPVLMAAAVTELVPALQGVEQLDDEAKADKQAFTMALVVSLGDAVSPWLASGGDVVPV